VERGREKKGRRKSKKGNLTSYRYRNKKRSRDEKERRIGNRNK
jgi:hypothetical protein